MQRVRKSDGQKRSVGMNATFGKTRTVTSDTAPAGESPAAR